MKKYLLAFLPPILILVLLLAFSPLRVLAIGDPSRCAGTPVDFGIEKKFIPIGPYPQSGRQGGCTTPKYIVIHTTSTPGSTAENTYQYFYNGSEGRGVGAHFVIGDSGEAIQMGETLDQEVDILNHAGGNNSNAIGIELTYKSTYNNKSEAPPAQYQKVLELVRALMKQYKIPSNDVNYGYEWKAPSDTFVDHPPGAYGHYQINPNSRDDPGAGFFKDFLQDLGSGGGAAPGGTPQTVKSNCWVTKVGIPLVSPVLPATCPSTGGLGIEGVETPPNLECKPDNDPLAGYCKMPNSTDDSYRFGDPSCHGQHWGSKELISILYTVAKNWKSKYSKGYLILSDLTAAGHESHGWGIAVDMDATTDGVDCAANYINGWRSCAPPKFNRTATVELGKMFVNTGILAQIWFDDASVDSEVLDYARSTGKSSLFKSTEACPECGPDHGGMRTLGGHDNHFHVDVDRPYLKTWLPSCSG